MRKRNYKRLIAYVLCICFLVLTQNTGSALSKKTRSKNYETEGNDSFETANQMEVNKMIFGRYDKADGMIDEDYYKFVLTEAGLIYVDELRENIETAEVVSGSAAEAVNTPASILETFVPESTETGNLETEAPVAEASAAGILETGIPVIETAAAEKMETEVPVIETAAAEKMETEVPVIETAAAEKMETEVPVIETAAAEKMETEVPVAETAVGGNIGTGSSVSEKKDTLHYSLYKETPEGEKILLTSNLSEMFNVDAGIYYVKITTEREGYYFTLHYSLRTENYEVESNNTIETATELAIDGVRIGNIQTKDDVDYYHMYCPEACMGRVAFMIPYDIVKGAFQITIFRVENGELKEIGTLYSDRVSANFSDTLVYPAGDYYFKVAGKKADSLVEYNIQFGKLDNDAGTINNLTIKLTDTGNLQLNWGQIVSATGYHIYLIESGEYNRVKTVYSGHNSFTYKVTKTGTFQFIIRPYYNIAGTEYETFDSNMVTYKIPGKLTKPTFTAKKKGKKKAKVKISSYKDAAQILIYMKKGSGDWKKKKTLKKAKTWTASVNKKGTYCFKIRGYKKYGSKAIYSPYTSTKKLKYK